MSKISFNNKQNPFFRSLKSKVDTYFTETKRESHGSKKLFIKGLIQVVSALIIYTILVFFTPVWYVSILLCMLFGFNLAVIGFNIMHEGGHQTFSSYKWLNRLSAYSLNFLGGNAEFWRNKHNINHHTYTNIEGLDMDIEVKAMRMHANQQWYSYHKLQHIYFIGLYSLAYIGWVYIQDFEKYFRGSLAPNQPKLAFSTKEHIIFWASKIGYTLVFVVLPFVLVGWYAIVGYLIICAVCGITLSVVFQLAHVVEGTDFPEPNAVTNKIEQEWAIHQIQTTANFSTGNRVLSWLLGGLNHQVEHHLFPRISHVHYPAISKMVKETCEEFNINYIEFPTMFAAFRSHYSIIRSLGKAA